MDTKSLTLVATYRRTIHASLERVLENVRDWEHLPWLHRSSFRSIELLEQTSTSWRARITMPAADAPREAEIELQIDEPNLRYWSRTLSGYGAGGEILTRLTPVDAHATNIVVEFRALVANPKQADTAGAAYVRLYQRLWDEDERMMKRRQELVEKGRIGGEPLRLRKQKMENRTL